MLIKTKDTAAIRKLLEKHGYTEANNYTNETSVYIVVATLARTFNKRIDDFDIYMNSTSLRKALSVQSLAPTSDIGEELIRSTFSSN